MARRTRLNSPAYARDLTGTYAGMVRQRAGARAVFWGDSLVAGSDTATAHGEAWPVYLGLISGQQIRYLNNAGIAGQTSTQILARFAADVAAYSPTVVFILDGTNDMGNTSDETAFATWKANKQEQVASVLRIGATPVLLTIPPNNNATGTLYNRKEEIIRWNAWLRRYAVSNGIDLIDTYALTVDSTNGNWQSGYFADGTHWNAAGMLAVANLVWSKMGGRIPAAATPLLCVDAIDEANLVTNGVFSGLSGTSLPSGWVDNAGAPSGSALSYTTDSAVPGQLLTVTSTATVSLRQPGLSFNLASSTMPSTSAGATSFSLAINPYQKGTLFIGSGATFEIAKVSSVSGGGPYTVNLARALRYAHAAGETVVANGLPGDVLAFSGLVTSNGGVAFRTRVDYSPSGSVRALDLITQAITRGVWYQETTIPAGSTQVQYNLDIANGTGVTSFGQLGLYNLTRMAA